MVDEEVDGLIGWMDIIRNTIQDEKEGKDVSIYIGCLYLYIQHCITIQSLYVHMTHGTYLGRRCVDSVVILVVVVVVATVIGIVGRGTG